MKSSEDTFEAGNKHQHTDNTLFKQSPLQSDQLVALSAVKRT